MLNQCPMERPGRGRLAEAPSDHPPVPPARIGVLLGNLGTPDGTDYWSMRRYLDEFLSDRRVIEWSPWLWQPILKLIVLSRRPFSSGENYRGIWNNALDESPLLTITRTQAAKLRARLMAVHGPRVLVDFCMRYGNPSTESVIRRMQAQGCERILFFPLYPQYAAATTGTANDHAFRALMKLRWQPAVRTVPAYYDEPAYIDALAGSIERAYAGLPERPTALVASYHGLPQSYFRKGDPYHCQCQKTSRLLAERLGWARAAIHTTFQSRFGAGGVAAALHGRVRGRARPAGPQADRRAGPRLRRRLRRDAGGDQRRDPRGLRARRRRALPLHPLPEHGRGHIDMIERHRPARDPGLARGHRRSKARRCGRPPSSRLSGSR